MSDEDFKLPWAIAPCRQHAHRPKGWENLGCAVIRDRDGNAVCNERIMRRLAELDSTTSDREGK